MFLGAWLRSQHVLHWVDALEQRLACIFSKGFQTNTYIITLAVGSFLKHLMVGLREGFHGDSGWFGKPDFVSAIPKLNWSIISHPVDSAERKGNFLYIHQSFQMYVLYINNFKCKFFRWIISNVSFYEHKSLQT